MVVVVDELLVANIALNRTLRSLLWYVITSPRFTTVTPVGTQYLLSVTRPSAGSPNYVWKKVLLSAPLSNNTIASKFQLVKREINVGFFSLTMGAEDR